MMCGTILIDLGFGFRAVIDAADYLLISSHKWAVVGRNKRKWSSRQYYAASSMGLRMHRLLLGLENGDPRQVDHINGDGLDNRRCNIRICDRQQNQWNRGAMRGTASGLKGVTPEGKRFAARIKIDGKSIRLGKYATAEEAHQAYRKKLQEVAGEFARYA